MTERSQSVRSSIWWRYLIGVIIGSAAIYFASRDLSLSELPQAFSGINYGWLLIGLLTAFATQFVKALRWQMLLKTEGFAAPYLRVLQYLLAGQLTNLFIPGRAGDIGRAIIVGNQGAGKMFSLGTVAIEKVLDLIVYALLASILVIQIPLPIEVNLSPFSLGLIAVISAIVLFVTVRYWNQLARIFVKSLFFIPEPHRGKLESWLKSAGASLNAFRRNDRTLFLILWTIIAWITGWLTNEFILRAFGLQLPFYAGLLLVIVLQAGISTNLVPGTIGVFEYLCVISLSLFDVAEGVSIAFGIVLHVIVLIPLIIGALTVLLVPDPFKEDV